VFKHGQILNTKGNKDLLQVTVKKKTKKNKTKQMPGKRKEYQTLCNILAI
jgi:hypothetical protein